MAQAAVNSSPFNCRWIQRGSEMRVSNWSYALCVRVHDNPRVVSEAECERCTWWQSSENGKTPCD